MRLYLSSCLTNSCLAVHGLTHVVGSSSVTTYSIVVGLTRVHRSTMCRFSRDPMYSLLPSKFVTSMTSVLPSQWPRESPHHRRIDGGRCGLPSIGTVRCHPWPCSVS